MHDVLLFMHMHTVVTAQFKLDSTLVQCRLDATRFSFCTCASIIIMCTHNIDDIEPIVQRTHVYSIHTRHARDRLSLVILA